MADENEPMFGDAKLKDVVAFIKEAQAAGYCIRLSTPDGKQTRSPRKIAEWMIAYQGRDTNAIQNFRAMRPFQSDIDGETSICCGGVELLAQGVESNLTAGGLKLYSFIHNLKNDKDRFRKYGEGEHVQYIINFPLSEYTNAVGLTARGARKSFDAACRSLQCVQWRTATHTGGISLIQSWMRPNPQQRRSGFNKCQITMDGLMHSLLEGSTPMLLPSALYRTNDHNHPWSWFLGWKLFQAYHLQYYGVHEKAARKDGVAEVKSSVVSLKRVTGIPHESDVEPRRRRELIMTPFERDLDELENLKIGTWRYLLQDGSETKGPITYEEFCKAYVIFRFAESFPVDKERALQYHAAKARKE